MKMAEVRMTMEEYLQLINGLTSDMGAPGSSDSSQASEPKRARKKSAYQRRYKANFKKIAPRFKLKSGKWKKNGFKMAVKMAHKMSRKWFVESDRKTIARHCQRIEVASERFEEIITVFRGWPGSLLESWNQGKPGLEQSSV